MENVALNARRISLSYSTTALEQWVLSGAVSVVYSCSAVSLFGLPQWPAFSTLATLAHEGRLICAKTEDLWRYEQKEITVLPSVDDPFRHEEEELIFYNPKLVNTPERLLKEISVQEILSLEKEVIRKHFPAYRVGPPLRKQEGSDLIRSRLRQGIALLEGVKLIELASPADSEFRRYSHSSLFLLTREALGLKQISDLSVYQDDPAGFIATAVLNALVKRNLQEKTDYAVLKAALVNVAGLRGSYRGTESPCFRLNVAFCEESAWGIFWEIDQKIFKDSTWVAHIVKRMDNHQLLQSKPLVPSFDMDEFRQLVDFQKLQYMSHLVSISTEKIGEIVGDSSDAIPEFLSGRRFPTDPTKENLTYLLMLFSSIFRLGEYRTQQVLHLLHETSDFSSCSPPPPWYPMTLLTYITAGKTEAVKNAIRWLRAH